jgi:hypothetical protein
VVLVPDGRRGGGGGAAPARRFPLAACPRYSWRRCSTGLSSTHGASSERGGTKYPLFFP